MFGFPVDPDDPNLPEPLRSILKGGIAKVEQVEDSEHALAEDTINKFWHFLDELGSEQLATFRHMMMALLHSPQPSWLANRMEGQADALMRMRYGSLCRNCGTASCKGSSPIAEINMDFRVDPKVQAEVERALNNQALMAEYNVVPNPAGPTDFKCGNCGVDIVSLEDRMRREPGKGGCSGCMAKDRHG